MGHGASDEHIDPHPPSCGGKRRQSLVGPIDPADCAASPRVSRSDARVYSSVRLQSSRAPIPSWEQLYRKCSRWLVDVLGSHDSQRPKMRGEARTTGIWVILSGALIGMNMRAILYSVVASIPVLAGWSSAVFVLQPFGHRVAAFAVIAVVLAGLLATLWRRHRPTRLAPLTARWILGRPLWLSGSCARWRVVCWLGLITWSGFAPGGSITPAKSKPAMIRVLTWNILVGTDRGAPWKRHGWSVRRKALEAALAGTKPDILCVQEALYDQLASLAIVLPGHHRVGVGRDDGRSAGEHCTSLTRRGSREPMAGPSGWTSPPKNRRQRSCWARSGSAAGPAP